MNCPSCNAVVDDGSKFCEECGTAITANTQEAPIVVALTPPPPPAGIISGATAPPPPAPAAVTVPPITAVPVAASAPTGDLTMTTARLVEATSGREINLAGTAGGIIGRSDSGEGWMPTYDLVPFGGGPEAGVGRRHAIIAIQDGQVTITDNNSVNYTFVNGKMLTPNIPCPLNDGDQVKIGRIVLIFRV